MPKALVTGAALNTGIAEHAAVRYVGVLQVQSPRSSMCPSVAPVEGDRVVLAG